MLFRRTWLGELTDKPRAALYNKGTPLTSVSIRFLTESLINTDMLLLELLISAVTAADNPDHSHNNTSVFIKVN